MNIHRFDTEDKFIEKSVETIVDAMGSKKGIVRIALSGGTTPQPIYTTLGKGKIDFEQVHQLPERGDTCPSVLTRLAIH